MKHATSIRFTEKGWRLLTKMAEADGITHTAMLEIAIREAARKRGIDADSGVQGSPTQGPATEE